MRMKMIKKYILYERTKYLCLVHNGCFPFPLQIFYLKYILEPQTERGFLENKLNNQDFYFKKRYIFALPQQCRFC